MEALALVMAADGRREAVRGLLAFGGQAYQLAAHILDSSASAEDAVQQAYLSALEHMPSGLPPEEARVWFLKVVANAARKHLRGELRRRGREAAVMTEMARASAGTAGADAEIVPALRDALRGLDEKHRLPVVLCCEQGLSHGEAAAVLDIPKRTLTRYVAEGIEELRGRLTRAGYAAAPAAVVGALAHTAPPVPTALGATLEKLVLEGPLVKGTGAAAITAAAKGGVAMKIVAGVIAAGALAGGAALFASPSTLHPQPSTSLSAPPAEAKPAPVNDYKGMQVREEVFEFAEKPAVKKEGDKVVITFASKGKCDATVNIVGPDGKVIRHLASGVLGANAPHPFQQGSLSQKLEWDGLTDTFEKAPAGCKVKVGLGLKAKFVRNLLYDPYDIGWRSDRTLWKDPCWMGDGDDGTVVLMQGFDQGSQYWSVRAFTKDGKYVRTLWPPQAKDLDKLGVKLTATTWGDKSPWSGWFGPFGNDNSAMQAMNVKEDANSPDGQKKKAERLFGRLGIKNCRSGPRPANLPGLKGWIAAYVGFGSPFPQIDQNEEWVYWAPRFNLKTGAAEAEFKEWGGTGVAYPWGARIGPGNESGVQFRVFARDGLAYAAARPGGDVVMRMSKDGRFVPFKENAIDEVGGKLLHTGSLGNGRGHFDSLDVTEDGKIVVGMLGTVIDEPITPEVVKKVVLPGDTNRVYVREKLVKEAGLKMLPPMVHIGVWDRDGKALTKDAVVGVGGGHGYAMDRDGNLYVNQGGLLPVGQKYLDGVAQPGDLPRQWGGSVIKFRGLGGKYPVGAIYGLTAICSTTKDWGPKGTPPPDAASLTFAGGGGKEVKVTGMLWAYGGQSDLPADQHTCDCNFSSMYLDDSARLWLPNNGVSGVMVVDSNGNRIMRVGQYGNVDDVEADVKAGKDGMRFAYVRAAVASDNWLVCADPGNVRMVQAALSYAAEETVPAP